MSFKNTKIKNIKEEQPAKVVTGTPVQQQWTILNFHETRINKIESYLGELDDKVSQNVTNETVSQRLDKVLEELETFKKELSQLKKKDNSTSLSLEE